jgi:hypothetical protein
MSEKTAQGLIESLVEIGDPDGTLGVARAIATEMLADPDKVRATLPAPQAEALLAAMPLRVQDAAEAQNVSQAPAQPDSGASDAGGDATKEAP